MVIKCDLDLIDARQKGRRLAADLGFTPADQAMVAAAITELGRNILEHAGRGEVLLEVIEGGSGRRGIAITASDHGPGIPDIKGALQGSYSVASGMGLGLRGVKGLMDSLDIVSIPGKGTKVTARKWKP